MVPPDSSRVSRAPPYSGTDLTSPVFAYETITLYGELSQALPLTFLAVMTRPTTPDGNRLVWAIPISLATTFGISFDFSSCRYLDVSVPCVRLHAAMNSLQNSAEAEGFPIRTSPDQSLLGNSPKHIAACRVLHRLLVPRHPPYALCSLFFAAYSLLTRIFTDLHETISGVEREFY